MKLRALWAVLAAWCQCSGAVDVEQIYAAHLLPEAPVVDGFLEAQTWMHAAEAGGSFWILGTNEPSPSQSFFRMGHTDEALFIGVICKEPRTGLIHAGEADGGALWNDDSVELFLQPYGEEPQQFIVNAIGSRWSRSELAWEAASVKGADYWSIEIRLPWQALGLASAPAPGSRWKFSLCRNIRTRWSPAQNTTWTSMDASYLEPDNYAVLEFAERLPEDARVPPEVSPPLDSKETEARQNENALAFSRHLSGTYLRTAAGEERLLFSQGPHVAPRISPTGAGILFNSTLGGTNGVSIHDPANGSQTRITDGRQANWSSDGQQIVFEHKGAVRVRDLASGRETTVSSSAGEACRFPVFGLAQDVYFVRSNGLYRAGHPQALVEAEISSAPSISPCGGKAAIQDGAHIHLLDLQSGVRTQLSFAPGVQCCPIWTLDGKGLVYLQKHDPLSSSGDVYYQRLGSETVGLVERDVQEGFDWFGNDPQTFRETELPGLGLRVWHGDDGWQPGAEARVPEYAAPITEASIKGKSVFCVGNDLGGIYVSTKENRVEYFYGIDGKYASPVKIVAKNPAGRDGYQIQNVEVLQVGQDLLRVRLSLDGSANVIENSLMDLSFSRQQPQLQIASPLAEFELVLPVTPEYWVAPDRLGSDFIVGADELAEKQAYLIAHNRMVLGLEADGRGMLVCIFNGADRRLSLKRDQDTGVVMNVQSTMMTMGGLCQPEKIWMQADIVRKGDDTRINWRHPYLATWSLTPLSTTSASTRILQEADLSHIRDGSFVYPGACPDDATRVLLFARSRSKNTPLEITTLEDVVLTGKGIGETYSVMKTLDSRGYRTFTNRQVPFLELTKPREDALPYQGYGVLDTFAGISISKTPALKEFVRHLCEDALDLLSGLDDRIEEYRQAVERLPSDAYPRALRDSLQQQREELDHKLAGHDTTSLDEVTKLADKIVASYSSGWEQFRVVCLQALAERRNHIALYRHAVCHAREQAKQMALHNPEHLAAADDLADKTSAILKNRFYLESEWDGEEPIDILWHD